MTEAKYFKDYKHNYLILKCESGETEGNYQYRMLASGKIERILKCSVRNINGAAYFYYDISSKVTLENLYRGKKITYEKVKDLFYQLNGIYHSLGQFFMEERGLLIKPENIYYDLTTGQYFGLYYPGTDEGVENIYESLMDFLIDHMDVGNQQLTDIVYRLYEMSDEKCFSAADALPLFEEEAENVSADSCIIAEAAAADAADRNAADNHALTNEDIEEWGEYPSYLREYAGEKETVEREKTKAVQNTPFRRKNIMFYACFAVLSLGGIGAALWIYMQYELTQQEFMMVVCCAAVMGLCFLFSLAQTILSFIKNKENDLKDEALKADIEDEFRDVRPAVLEGVLQKNMDLPAQRRHYAELPAHVDEAEMAYGETVFLDVRKQKREFKLYALDKKNKKHIELTQFPFTIGKMAGCVDCVLADDSISRLHARIEKQDDKIFLTDMNSTNGTYKNGLRMEPSQTIEIEPGDEIRFGKLNYCYR